MSRMKRFVCIAVSLMLIPLYLGGESLWEPTFPGYITGSSSFNPGDSLLIVIDSESSLSVDATLSSSKRLTIELTGGEGAGLFDFLPGGSSSGSESLHGSQEIELKTVLPVTIVEIEPGGYLSVEGGRTLSVFGKEESISLTGVIDPELIEEGRRIPFSAVSEASLTYTTTLDPGAAIVTDADIEEVGQPAGAPQTAGAPGATGVQPGATGPSGTGAQPAGAAALANIGGSASAEVGVSQPETQQTVETETALRLTEERRRELLLLYLNRMIDLIFAQP